MLREVWKFVKNPVYKEDTNTEISQMSNIDENQMFAIYNHSGRQHPVDVRI